MDWNEEEVHSQTTLNIISTTAKEDYVSTVRTIRQVLKNQISK